MGLAGKFFFYGADEYYQFGVVKEQFDDVLLLQYWAAEEPELRAALAAVSLGDVLEDFDQQEYAGEWLFFEAEKELRDYLAWVERLQQEGDAGRPKVVSIKTQTTPNNEKETKDHG